MPFWTCFQCGAKFPDSLEPSRACPVCEDKRQFVNWSGQSWLTREDFAQRYKLVCRDELVVIGIAAYLTFKHYCRMTVAAASSPVSVTLYGTVAVTATLQRKSWLFGSWTPVTPATITATPTGTANATVAGSPASAAAPGATVSIIGATVGSTTIKISGTGGDCTSISADIPVAVV